MSEPPVIVVGAGPTGLTLACELLRHGIDCRVIDAAPQPSTTSKALALWPRTLEVLHCLSVAKPAIERGLCLDEGVINSRGRPIGRISMEHVDTRFRFALIVPQPEIEQILTERLHELGGTIDRPTAFVEAREENDALLVRLKRKQPEAQRNAKASAARAAKPDEPFSRAEETDVWTDWLIGCDGANSTVRTVFGFVTDSSSYAETFLLADATVEWSEPPKRAQYFLSPAGLLHMVPLPSTDLREGLWRYRFTLDTVAGAGDTEAPSLQSLQREVQRRGPGGITLTDIGWTSAFRIHRRTVDRYRRGRCLLAGDAAHVHSPAGGQGINTGIQDAQNLAWKLALVIKHAAPRELLDTYETERMPVAAEITRTTDHMTRLGMAKRSGVVKARDAAAQLLDTLGLFRRVVAPATAGVRFHYRSAIVARGRAAGVLAPCLIEASCGTPDSQTTGVTGPSALQTGASKATMAMVCIEGALRSPNHVALLYAGIQHTQSHKRLGILEQCIRDALTETFGTDFELLTVVPPFSGLARDSSDAGRAVGPASVDDDRWLIDTTLTCHRRHGALRSLLMLVRPDGYIAYRGSLAASGLRAYLRGCPFGEMEGMAPGEARSTERRIDLATSGR